MRQQSRRTQHPTRRHCRGLRRRPRAAAPVVLAALIAIPLTGANAAGAATARAARSFSINDTGHLHKTSGRGITINQVLNEQGTATGTIAGTIYIHLKVVSPNRVTAEVNIYPKGSSITGRASAELPRRRRGRDLQRHHEHRARHRPLPPRARVRTVLQRQHPARQRRRHRSRHRQDVRVTRTR